jgi:hypothetical protein
LNLLDSHWLECGIHRLNRKLDSFQHPDAWITLGR